MTTEISGLHFIREKINNRSTDLVLRFCSAFDSDRCNVIRWTIHLLCEFVQLQKLASESSMWQILSHKHLGSYERPKCSTRKTNKFLRSCTYVPFRNRYHIHYRLPRICLFRSLRMRTWNLQGCNQRCQQHPRPTNHHLLIFLSLSTIYVCISAYRSLNHFLVFSFPWWIVLHGADHSHFGDVGGTLDFGRLLTCTSFFAFGRWLLNNRLTSISTFLLSSRRFSFWLTALKGSIVWLASKRMKRINSPVQDCRLQGKRVAEEASCH